MSLRLPSVARRTGPVWTLVLALLAPSLCLGAADSEQTRRQLQQLQRDIRQLEQRLDKARGEEKGLQAALGRIETEAGQLSARQRKGEQAIAAARQEVSALKARKLELMATRDSQQRVLAEQLRAAFHTGRQDRIKLLLNQEDPQRVARLLTYYDYLSRARLEAITAHEATLASLTQVESDLARRQQTLRQELEQLEDRSRALVQSRKERQQALAGLGREIKSDKQQLSQLKGNQKRLEGVLEELRRVLELNDIKLDNKAFSELKGKLSWPTKGRLSQTFGERSSLGMKAEGILIDAPMGTEVRAVHTGRVVFSDWLRGFGLLLIVDHGGGYMTLYGHNQSLLKEVGDWVTARETIATVGDSGGQARSGLYFAVRHQGKPQNPQPWLERRRG